jgi:hypothetical protein
MGGNLADLLRQYHVYRDPARSEPGLPPSTEFRGPVLSLLGWSA